MLGNRVAWKLSTCGFVAAAILMALQPAVARAADTWKPAKGPLMTRWAEDVSPDNVLPEYPRPQMVRKDWQNLNGLWDYSIAPKDNGQPEAWGGQILVPFPIESALSGVMKTVGPDSKLWYHRKFEVPDAWRANEQRVLLHFGAVDWQSTIYVNGKKVGAHQGGYDPFTCDITAALNAGAAQQELVVEVWDPTDAGVQPIGKQRLKPEGIWYTAVTGIWQTVWMEPVPKTSVDSLTIVPDLDASSVRVTVNARGSEAGARVKVEISPVDVPNFNPIASGEGTAGKEIVIKLDKVQPWTPDMPRLYPMRVSFGDDRVDSYFGMRKTSLGKDAKGITRLMLNNQFVFQYGPLDQGWWPDGLYTAPTDEALRYDIEMTKKFGCNMARKHVKVEPARWYYWCDKLGLLVWQDMPSKFIGARDARAQESAEVFEAEWPRIMTALYNFPSIVMWVPFNEGWGQYDTPRIVDVTRKHDPSRLVNNASGWTDMGVGDVNDIHVYRGPGAPPAEEKRAIVLGEFGGLGLPIEGHMWKAGGRNWGYEGLIRDQQELTDTYVDLLRRLHRLVGEPGLSAGVYTQTTDVEIEVNGLMTYDRAVTKMDVQRIAAAARQLYQPPPEVETVVPDARTSAQPWKYTTQQPADGWEKPDFADTAWSSGDSGFGTKGTPKAIVNTEWNTNDIWLRRTFEWPAGKNAGAALLTIHHDEDAEVYINGVRAMRLRGYTVGYEEHSLSAAAEAALKPGKNVLAIHCKQTTGGQYIDAGLVILKPGK